jgi:large subunit ribosomal protein L10
LGLNLDEKKAVVTEVSAEVAKAQVIIVAEYRGLEVGNMTNLRREARKAGVYLRVLKNTLARRAVEGTPFAGLSEHLVGPLVYGISPDPVATAKLLSDFAKSNDKLVIKAGAMPNAVISAKDVKSLASMPSREELLSKLLGTMQAPIAQFVRTLNEVPTRFVRGVAAVRDKKEKEGAAA